MRFWKTMLVILVTGVLLATLFGCSKKAATTTTTQYTVTRSNISNTITAAGNLALAQTQDLPVSLFYPNGVKGTIASVLVQLGDTVKAGQVLVTIDPDEWADQLTTVQNNLSTAQRNVTTKTTAMTDAQRSLNNLQNAVATSQVNVTKAQRAVTSAQLGVTSAQLNITSANDTLNSIAEVQKAKNDIDDAQTMIRVCNMNLASGSGDSLYWLTQRDNAQKQLAAAQAYYNDLVQGLNMTVSSDIALQIAQKELALNQAVLAVNTAQQAVDDANTAVISAQQTVDDANYAVTKQQLAVTNAQSDLDTANTALATAQKKLTDAQAMSPNVVAPFDGFITSVGVKGGDEVLNGMVAVTVADPTKFQANILVSEMNIMSVHVGGQATMSLNALSGFTLPAAVTQIAPTASISSGVVNYAVTVNITSVTPVASGSIPSLSANATGRQPGSASGNFTTRAGVTPTPGAGSSATSGRAATQLPTNIQLKQGLSGTVSLILSQSNNVLVVPNAAITKSGAQSTVNVVTGNNTSTIEKRTIQTGLSDFQNTQVISGLNEGDNIQYSKTSSVAAKTTTAGPPGGGGIFLGR